MIATDTKPSVRLREHPFDVALSVLEAELELELTAYSLIPWSEFLLNPRRLRGSDFLMRWSQGEWSEERIIQAVNETNRFIALPYGPSGTAPDDDVQAFELYFERLEKAGLGGIKRPDLLIFPKEAELTVKSIVQTLGGIQELPFTPENDANMRALLSKAIIAVECENSLWKAKQMPGYGKALKPMKRLGGKLGLSKSAVLPNVIIKKEDLGRLISWQQQNHVDIHIWHVFYDMAFGISLDRAEELINEGLIEPKEQVFQAPGGATTKKTTFFIYYHYAYPLGESHEEPTLVADHLIDKNGHILPYVKFKGGKLLLTPQALQTLDRAGR